MKVVWEEKDIRGGTVVGCWDISERWIIAYTNECDGRGLVYQLISLSDGLIGFAPVAADLMAARLNTERMVPVEFLETKFAKGQHR